MISEVKNYKLLEVKSDRKKQEKLQKVYYDLFNEHLVIGCDGCIQDGIFRINYYLKKQKTMADKKELNFKLKDNVVLYVHAIGDHITNNNLTDELAVRVLKLNRKNLGHFEKYPKNINEYLENFGSVKVEPKEPEEPVVEEVKIEEPEPANTASDGEITNVTEEVVEPKRIFTMDELMKMRKSELLDIVDDFRFTNANNKIDIAKEILNKQKNEGSNQEN